MQHETKEARNKRALELLERYAGEPKTVHEWLRLVNEQLPKQNRFESAKSFAIIFRRTNVSVESRCISDCEGKGVVKLYARIKKTHD